MSFEAYLNQAWNEHAAETQKVAQNFSQGLELVQNPSQLDQLIGLVTHVMGEHLGQWNQGLQFLDTLKTNRFFLSSAEVASNLSRSAASLKLSADQEINLDVFSSSDKVRILAVSSSALAERDVVRAKKLLSEALNLAPQLDSKDPANRSLAITGNNLASALEEKQILTLEEKEFMILSAQTGLKYWQIAGTWLQVERAEFRLANTYLKAADLSGALTHSQKCLAICQENSAPGLEFFFAYETLARVQKALGLQNEFLDSRTQAELAYSELSEGDKIWCKTALQKLKF